MWKLVLLINTFLDTLVSSAMNPSPSFSKLKNKFTDKHINPTHIYLSAVHPDRKRFLKVKRKREQMAKSRDPRVSTPLAACCVTDPCLDMVVLVDTTLTSVAVLLICKVFQFDDHCFKNYYRHKLSCYQLNCLLQTVKT